MTDWFDELVRDAILKALQDFYQETRAAIESAALDYLGGLEAGKQLASSPLVKVTAVDNNSVTFLIRGRLNLFKGKASAFMRIEVIVSKTALEVLDWTTVIGELQIVKKKVFDARLGLGYDNGIWLGRGALKIIPAGFGLDIFLGGLNDRGAVVGLDMDLPAPVPLGSTGLALMGMGGDFAYNFIARLEEGLAAEGQVPTTIMNPTAIDYVRWARNHEIDRWVPGPIDETAVGIGIRTDLGDAASKGSLFILEPIGLAVLTPGPIFILGGTGKLLKTNSARVEAYAVVDIPGKSLALGAGATIKIPQNGALVNAVGLFDAFFSFEEPSAWFVHVGTKKKPIKAKILGGTYGAEVWLMMNNNQIAFGVKASIGGEWKWWIIALIARIGAGVAALLGWNPKELAGEFTIFGELGFRIWKFKFILSGSAIAYGHIPEPKQLKFILKYKLDLPWPIPDIKGDKEFLIGDQAPSPAVIASPLLANGSKIGAIHAPSGRQWELGKSAPPELPWPDLQIVIPFSRRTIDTTGYVLGTPIGAEVNGGYQVKHKLNKLEIYDLVNNTVVPQVQAVWANGPDGESARLHILGEDPYAWMTPHEQAWLLTAIPTVRTIEQHFGHGDEEEFTGERRFGEVLINPANRAILSPMFSRELPTRVINSDELGVRFKTTEGDDIFITQLVFFVVESEWMQGGIDVRPSTYMIRVPIMLLNGDLELVSYTLDLSASPTSELHLVGVKQPLHLYGVRYRGAPKPRTQSVNRAILLPGNYRLALEGQSTAVSLHGMPRSTPVDWKVEQEFKVAYPETIRPYLHYTTLGDSRLFRDEGKPWNPTMYGFGFPAYRNYLPVVRFVVPYLKEIFDELTLRIIPEDETVPSVEQELDPATNPDGESASLTLSQDYITWSGGTLRADQELVLTQALPDQGAAQVQIWFNPDGGTQKKLDQWSCYISRFGDFKAHLNISYPRLTTLYSPDGPTTVPTCAITGGTTRSGGIAQVKGNRIDTKPFLFESSRSTYRLELGPLLAQPYVTDESLPFPEEYSSPPVSWQLPSSMTRHLGPLDSSAGIRFLRFAADSGAQLSPSAAQPLLGLTDASEDTTLEGLSDTEARLFALWLRTPEPLDWRRVTASLRIRHTQQTGACPGGYEHRQALDVDLDILPSPDASSAFLAAKFNGSYTRLPRGEYELTLSFDPSTPSLYRLRPGAAVGTTPEVVVIKFIQPMGPAWPLPSDSMIIPGVFFERLIRVLNIPPDVLHQLFEVSPTVPSSDPIFSKLKESLRAAQVPAAVPEETTRLLPRLEVAAQPQIKVQQERGESMSSVEVIKGPAIQPTSKEVVARLKSGEVIARPTAKKTAKGGGKTATRRKTRGREGRKS
jgi:hypothetical protein